MSVATTRSKGCQQSLGRSSSDTVSL